MFWRNKRKIDFSWVSSDSRRSQKVALKSLGWLSIEDKLRLNTAVMVHKCLHHRVPIYLKDKFVYRSQVHNRQLRSVDNNDLNLPHCRLSTGQRSFAFRRAKVWSSLPLDLKLTPSLRTFKKNVHELLSYNLLWRLHLIFNIPFYLIRFLNYF